MKHVLNRNGHLYFRVRVPADLIRFFPCKEIRKTLQSKKLSDVRGNLKTYGYKIESVFAVIRGLILSGKLTDSVIRKLVKNYLTESLNGFEKSRLSPLELPDAETLKELLKEQQECDNEYDDADEFAESAQPESTDIVFDSDLSEGDLSSFFPNTEKRDSYCKYNEREIKALKDGLGLGKIPQFVEFRAAHMLKDAKLSQYSVEEFRSFCFELIKTELEILKTENARSHGDYENRYDRYLEKLLDDGTKTTVNTAMATCNGKLLSVVLDEFIEEKTALKAWNAKNAFETKTFFAQLIELLGDRDITAYTRTDLQKYFTLLSKFPKNINKLKELRDIPLLEIAKQVNNDELKMFPTLGVRTINKKMILVNALFGYAQEQGFIHLNPASKLKLQDKRKQDELKEPYSKEDLLKAFSSPKYLTPNQEHPEWFWIPLISLYSGLRLGEVSQLYVEDIKDIDGIPCFDINDDNDKELKTIESKRIVPIHPILIELGLLKYVKKLKSKRLWMNLDKGRDGYGHRFSRWYSRYNRQHITKHKKRSFHSFRHSFINNLKQNKVEPSIIAELVGHEHEGYSMTLGTYAEDYHPPIKLAAIKKLNYGIDISKLKFK